MPGINTVKYWGIVPAAGRSMRMNSAKPKQYLKIAGKTIIEHAVAPLLECVQMEKIVVVTAADDPQWGHLPLAKHHKIITAIGGAERCHSVYHGVLALQAYANDQDWVLVHDAARPLLQKHDVNKLISTLSEHPIGGLLGAPINATIKRINANNTVLETVPRRHLWRAFTPQMFRFGILHKALMTALPDNPTSDSAKAIEQLGYAPQMVEGRSDNIKVTRSSDLVWVEKLLETRG